MFPEVCSAIFRKSYSGLKIYNSSENNSFGERFFLHYGLFGSNLAGHELLIPLYKILLLKNQNASGLFCSIATANCSFSAEPISAHSSWLCRKGIILLFPAKRR